MKTNNYLISLSELDDYLAKKIPLIIQKYLDDFEANRSSTLNQDDLLFISPKLDHPFRSKLNHPELPVKEGVKIGLIFG